MTPTNGTALTNASGVATITLLATGSTSGATTISATAQVSGSALTNSLGFSVGAATITVSTPVFGIGSASLSAFGTTSVSVTVSSGGTAVTTPMTVAFTSSCATSGKAVLGSVVTVNGIATGSYRDNGCAGSDTVVASVGGATSSASLTVQAPATGSIQYVSAVPTNIGLQGSGSTTTSLVTFKVVDSGGNPISGKTVTFGLSTYSGGIYLSSSTGISDSSGLVVARVNSGISSTPVRVTATTPSATAGVTLTSQSSQLSVTTGIPDNSDFTISATQLNIDGWNYDGATTVITARLADHFKNPAPDGTSVNFTSEAGSIADSTTGKIGSCSTVGGSCSAVLTTSGVRPNDGRVTVLAYALGEESFTDLNNNGVADLNAGVSAPAPWSSPNEMFDITNTSTDLPDAWVDYNEDGIYEANEPFFDLFQNAPYAAADGKYSGVLCNANSSPGTCASSQTVYIRHSLVITFSGHDAKITMPTVNAATTQSYNVKVVDLNGNALPAGTTISMAVSGTGGSTINGVSSYVVPSTNGCNTVNINGGCGVTTGVAIPGHSATFGNYGVSITAVSPGLLTVTVTTPSPNAITTTATVGW